MSAQGTNDSSLNRNLDSTKSPITPSHEALESQNEADGEQKHLDQSAMSSAKRAQNRIHNDEETTPDSSIFSK